MPRPPLRAEVIARKRVGEVKRLYCYDVMFDGELVVEGSDDPEHDLARALLVLGHKGVVNLYCGAMHRVTINIANAVKYRVVDGDKKLRIVKYIPHPGECLRGKRR